MAYLLDFHLLAHVIVYFASIIGGLVVSIPVGVTTAKMDHMCLLYATVTRKDKLYFHMSSMTSCNFPVYVSVAGILYAISVGIYYIYALTRKDPNIGAQVWVIPFTFISVIQTILVFVSACMISVGFKTLCDNYSEVANGRSCKTLELVGSNWEDTNIDSSTFYEYLTVAEIACWSSVLAWLTQVALGIARMIRNRRQNSQATGSRGDTSNVTSVEPTA